MSVSKDLETYKEIFGNEKIVYSRTITFIYKENGKERTLISSIFLTAEHITVINTKNSFKYRIPLGDIKDISTDRRVLKYYVHLKYGDKYNASIDFTNKGDGQIFISLLDLAIEVDRKSLNLKKKANKMDDELNIFKKQMSELDSNFTRNKNLSSENIKTENKDLDSRLENELRDIYLLKKELKTEQEDWKNTYNTKITELQKYKDEELTKINDKKKNIMNNISKLKLENEKLTEEINKKKEKIKLYPGSPYMLHHFFFFFFQAEDGIRDS